MGDALGFEGGSGKQFLRTVKGSRIAPYLGDELAERLDNPIRFQGVGKVANTVNGYDVTILIDVCKAITRAEADGKWQIPKEDAETGRITVGIDWYRPEIVG